MRQTQSFLFSVSALVVTFMMSCTSVYQVLETRSSDTKLENNFSEFENDDIKVRYNFWSEGGQVYFMLYNKLDSAIYINWDKSHLIYNGISYEYWYDTEESNSFYSSASSGSSYTFADATVNILGGTAYGNSNSNTSIYGRKAAVVTSSKSKPKKIIQIPPKSSIVVSKFSISKAPFYDCNFNSSSVGTTANTKTFDKDNSPLTFRNYLTYSTKDSFEKNQIIDNSFYISSISFITKKSFLGKSSAGEDCYISGVKRFGVTYSEPYRKPTAFYIAIKQN